MKSHSVRQSFSIRHANFQLHLTNILNLFARLYKNIILNSENKQKKLDKLIFLSFVSCFLASVLFSLNLDCLCSVFEEDYCVTMAANLLADYADFSSILAIGTTYTQYGTQSYCMYT